MPQGTGGARRLSARRNGSGRPDARLRMVRIPGGLAFVADRAGRQGAFGFAMLRRAATLRSRHLLVGGVFYLTFLIGAVFAVV